MKDNGRSVPWWSLPLSLHYLWWTNDVNYWCR